MTKSKKVGKSCSNCFYFTNPDIKNRCHRMLNCIHYDYRFWKPQQTPKQEGVKISVYRNIVDTILKNHNKLLAVIEKEIGKDRLNDILLNLK